MQLQPDPELANYLEKKGISQDLFQWDLGNTTKNQKHGVKPQEVEELFCRSFVLGGKILKPLNAEDRWILFGQTLKGRYLSLIFTLRQGLIRPISCRPMRKEERKIYEEVLQETSTRSPSQYL